MPRDIPTEPTIEMGLAGATEVNRHMRGPGQPADFDAAMDAYRAMVAYALEQEGEVHG